MVNNETSLSLITGADGRHSYTRCDAISHRTSRGTDTAPIVDLSMQWRQLARGVDGDSITVHDVRTMDERTYAVLCLAALRGARKGRALASDPVGISPDEDECAVHDAVQRLYGECIDPGRVVRSPARRVYWIARSFGRRRAKDRIRERASVIVEEATDRKVPAADASATWAELRSRVPASRLAMFDRAKDRWIKGEDTHGHAIRDIRSAVGIVVEPRAPTRDYSHPCLAITYDANGRAQSVTSV